MNNFFLNCGWFAFYNLICHPSTFKSDSTCHSKICVEIYLLLQQCCGWTGYGTRRNGCRNLSRESRSWAFWTWETPHFVFNFVIPQVKCTIVKKRLVSMLCFEVAWKTQLSSELASTMPYSLIKILLQSHSKMWSLTP